MPSAAAALLAAFVQVSTSPPPAVTAADLLQRAEAERRRGDPPAALLTLRAARSAARAEGDVRAEGSALYQTGQIQAQTGALQDALDTLGAALDLWVGLEDARMVATAISGRGIVYRHLGELERALDCYREALFLTQEGGFLREQGRVLTNIAVIQADRGDLGSARDALQQGLELKQRAGDTASLALTINNLAKLHALQGHYDLAIEYYRRGFDLAAQGQDAAVRASSLTNLASVLREAGRGGEARAPANEALAIASAASLAEIASTAELVLAELELDAGRPDAAERHAARGLEEARRAREERVVAEACAVLSRARLARGAMKEALQAARDGVAAAERIDVAWMLIMAHQAAGESYRALGQLDEATRSFEAAVAAIERSRERLAGGEEDRQRFLERHLDPYHALADLAFSAGDAARGLEWAERARGRVLAEVLQGGRVEVRASLSAEEVEEERAVQRRLRAAQAAADAARGPERAPAVEALERARGAREALRARLYAAHPEVRLARGEAEPAALASAAGLADGRTALLLYTAAREHTWLMALTAGPDGHLRSTIHRIPESRAALTARIQRFRDALGARDLAVADSARELHRLLLGPAQESLAGRSRLVIVPDGPLWELPFAALARAPGHYLLDDVALSLAPSLTALVALDGARPRVAGGRRLFALGNPADPSEPPLPETERQVQALARLYGPKRSVVRLGREAREGVVKEQAGGFAILHFATHGQADDASPMYSSLLLAREADDAREDGRLEARELIDLPLRADLAVLSACETGRGRVGGGEGMIGLSWAILVAGARNAVVSHWRVDAASSEVLMVELHRRLLEGRGERDAAGALRAAARAVRSDPRFRHPFYWAGFSLVGSGRTSAD